MNVLMTDYEKEILYGYINGIWAKQVLERDKEKITKAKFKYPEIYEEWISELERKNGEHLHQTRNQMKMAEMKIWEIRTEDPKKGIKYGCSYRGYHSDHHMMPRVLRKNVENHIRMLVFNDGRRKSF
ncbi:hypothetical protein [Alkalicoccus daliensis]|uniref:Uncharacterized protein n=1 Tax=Alkalicoccus daliensis TaxID=745820 RepID=A0A1H0EWN3_9BACI|nr:hypothetical protein [Alkalicoccus daliensis]SDN86726.1 hypothetical protein SAMN04488053_10497 [Alkalicoccus daliensis]